MLDNYESITSLNTSSSMFISLLYIILLQSLAAYIFRLKQAEINTKAANRKFILVLKSHTPTYEIVYENHQLLT